MRKFDFPEIDLEGRETLDIISDADNYNRWIYEVISPHTEGDILEIGSGIGNISKYFLANQQSIQLSEIRKVYRDALREKYKSFDPVVYNLDISDSNFAKSHPELVGKFDTVFSLNVIEHIEDDYAAIGNCKQLLKPGGKIIILVPCYEFLYNRLDKSLSHYRRYNKKSLSKLISSEFNVLKTTYLNSLGTGGWFFSGVILRKNVIPKGQMNICNRFVPLLKTIDKLINHSIGLSIIMVGKKQ